MTGTAVDRLRNLDACAVSDALDALGLPGAVVGVRSVTSPARVTGRVITVDLTDDLCAASSRHLGTAAVDAAGPDEVIVVAHRGRMDISGWGGVLSAGASARRVAGVVVDGAVRDVDQARDYGFPVFARGAVTRTARGRVVERAWNEPVEFGGIAVNPGDYVIADGSGVVFVAASAVEAVLERAEAIVAKEDLMAERALAGHPMVEVMGHDYESLLNENQEQP